MAIFPGSAIPSAVSDYEIENSLRFNSADDPYLSRTPSSAGNRKTFTLSFWVKKSVDTTEHCAIANVYSAGNDND